MSAHSEAGRTPKSLAKKGLIIVNTGDGKGKTTAAIGLAFRATGQGLRVCMVQFIKGVWQPGEAKAAPRLAPNLEVIPMGLGFTWLSRDIKKDEAKAQQAWTLAKGKIASGDYDIVILDELTHAIKQGFVNLDDVLETLKGKRESLHVVITGRGAPAEIIEMADLVTEMRPIKHPYDKGVIAQRGIEF